MGPSPCATGAYVRRLTARRNRACPLAIATNALDPHRAGSTNSSGTATGLSRLLEMIPVGGTLDYRFGETAIRK
jgi:hypothetical protein